MGDLLCFISAIIILSVLVVFWINGIPISLGYFMKADISSSEQRKIVNICVKVLVVASIFAVVGVLLKVF